MMVFKFELIKELIKGILQMLLLISWLHLSLAPALIEHLFLGWHNSASPTLSRQKLIKLSPLSGFEPGTSPAAVGHVNH